MLDKKQLASAFASKLKASALTMEDASKLGFTAYTAEQVEALPKLAVSMPAGGFVIPYYDPAQNYTGFFRFRYLEQPRLTGFAAIAARKEMRYTQPPALKPRVYFSPLYPWPAYFARPAAERPLYITEGELKANCACKNTFPTIALGGVWNFRSARANEPLIPDLGDMDLKDVVVYIVYDSDAVTNPEVLKAENALARELLKRGAVPKVIRLPNTGRLKKTGLDDYLVVRGRNSFDKLTAKAEEWEASRALHEFNEEYLFLRESATVMDLQQRHRWTASTAVNSVLRNRKFTVTEIRKKESVLVEKRTADEWLQWEGRTELETITYRPGEPSVVDRMWNGWRGWGLTEDQVKAGDVGPWKALLDFVFSGHDPLHRKWFEQWLAYPLQHPGFKLFTATLLWGLPGTGKTLVGHTMARIYGENYTEVNERELHASFNEWAEYKQFALGDEITGGDKRGVADYLKGLITQKFLRINPKHIKPYTVPDCINWLFTSNHCDAFFVDDDDRRYFIIEIKNSPRPREFYMKYDEWYKSTAGAGALFHHLLHLPLKGFDPMGPAPRTRSREEMISDGRSDVGSWCAQLRTDPDAVLKVAGGPPLSRKLWTTVELYALYDPIGRSRVTPNGLSRELKRAGFRKALDGEPLRTSRGLVKLWVIRRADELVKPADFTKLFEAERR